ncbi:MAG: type III-B CRISPR-associated protein Cas10/Cmr2 [Candidatus Latescibacterota bacterium]
MSTKFRNDPNYWDRKLAAFLHDPPDKALRIPGHEDRAAALLEAFGLGDISLDKELYGRADAIASGMDRAQLPGFSRDADKNGAVNFSASPLLTHPTGAGHPLRLGLPMPAPDVGQTSQAMARIVRADSDRIANAFPGRPDACAAARFHYAFLGLRERLVAENAAGLGGLWRRLPADTRIPDHSVWQHCGLVSALASCFAESPKGQANVLVISLTPVQDFIGRARKLRDFWTGSLVLSWLAFEGIRAVAHLLGADHVLYPSLAGQPLLFWLLEKECGCQGMKGIATRPGGSEGVATFPNKLVCLVPCGREAELAGQVAEAMQAAWRELGEMVRRFVEKKIGATDAHPRSQFARQMSGFFTCQWAASPLVDAGKAGAFQQLLPPSVWKPALEFDRQSQALSRSGNGAAALYPVSHALAQALLAAGKTTRSDTRGDAPGIKCQLHPDLEALRRAWKDERVDKNPRPADDPFWKALRQALATTELKETERLSSVALVKRLALRAVKEMGKDHPLALFFNEAETFPSTTEMALTSWLAAVQEAGLADGLGETWRRDLAQLVHETDEASDASDRPGAEISDLATEQKEHGRQVLRAMDKRGQPVADSDKYYAILLMDGDHMGRLVNGETVAATWRSVLHPDLVRRLERPAFVASHRTFWAKNLDQRRLLAPAVHAAISEALGDFALQTVPRLIRRYRGRLIYAGGDDVCAVLPAATALDAARDLARAYGWGFVHSDQGEGAAACGETWPVASGHLGIHLGQGTAISISAGILVVHHKRPLAAAIRRAHELLERAKHEGGRNALAVELAKRGGGSRFFIARWDETPLPELALPNDMDRTRTLLDHFLAVSRAMDADAAATVSSSFLYRVGELEAGAGTVLRKRPEGLVPFLLAAMRKKLDDPKWLPLASSMAALLARKDRLGSCRVEPEPLVMARFFGTLNDRPQGTRRTP